LKAKLNFSLKWANPTISVNNVTRTKKWIVNYGHNYANVFFPIHVNYYYCMKRYEAHKNNVSVFWIEVKSCNELNQGVYAMFCGLINNVSFVKKTIKYFFVNAYIFDCQFYLSECFYEFMRVKYPRRAF
jgi:hypothetical protein